MASSACCGAAGSATACGAGCLGIGVLGHLLFLAGELHSLMIGKLSEEVVALGALVSALGLMLTGIAVLIEKRWPGWTRWMPWLAETISVAGDGSLACTGRGDRWRGHRGLGAVRLALGVAIVRQAPGAVRSGRCGTRAGVAARLRVAGATPTPGAEPRKRDGS